MPEVTQDLIANIIVGILIAGLVYIHLKACQLSIKYLMKWQRYRESKG